MRSVTAFLHHVVGSGPCPPRFALWQRRSSGLRAEPADGDIMIGGASLAAEAAALV
jgi:hypothetical protein